MPVFHTKDLDLVMGVYGAFELSKKVYEIWEQLKKGKRFWDDQIMYELVKYIDDDYNAGMEYVYNIPYIVVYDNKDEGVLYIYFLKFYLYNIYRSNYERLHDIRDYIEEQMGNDVFFDVVATDEDKDTHNRFLYDLQMAVDINNAGTEEQHDMISTKYGVYDENDDWDSFLFNEIANRKGIDKVFFVIREWFDVYWGNLESYIKENIPDFVKTYENTYALINEFLNSERSADIIPKLTFVVDKKRNTVFIKPTKSFSLYQEYPMFFMLV